MSETMKISNHDRDLILEKTTGGQVTWDSCNQIYIMKFDNYCDAANFYSDLMKLTNKLGTAPKTGTAGDPK